MWGMFVPTSYCFFFILGWDFPMGSTDTTGVLPSKPNYSLSVMVGRARAAARDRSPDPHAGPRTTRVAPGPGDETA